MSSKQCLDTATLPFDILLTIIDKMAYSNDIYTLRSCSLLCYDLLPHCRKYLFHTFDMRKAVPDTTRYFFKFYKLLTESPHLTRYIRFVHILGFHESPGPDVDWLQNQPFIAHLLHLLTNVEAFGLYCGDLVCMRWGDIVPEVRSGIMQIVARPCCLQLILENVEDIPRSLLDNCRFLRFLHITACSLESLAEEGVPTAEEKLDIVPESNWVHLEGATFSNAENFFQSLYPCSSNFPLLLNFSSLRDLTVTLSPDTLEATWKLIHSVSQTLETLTINQTYRLGTIGDIIEDFFPLNHGCLTFEGSYQTLSALSCLYRFSFLIMLHDFEEHSDKEHLSELCRLLRTCPPAIKEINVKIDLFFTEIDIIEYLFLSAFSVNAEDEEAPLLQDLDKTLSDRSLFPCLDNVEIEILLADEYAHTTDSEYADDEPPAELMEFDKIEGSVSYMMELTKKSLEGRGCLSINVKVGNRIG